jgi:hypothetical protein
VRQLAHGARQWSSAIVEEQLNHLVVALRHLCKEESTVYVILQKQGKDNAIEKVEHNTYDASISK